MRMMKKNGNIQNIANWLQTRATIGPNGSCLTKCFFLFLCEKKGSERLVHVTHSVFIARFDWERYFLLIGCVLLYWPPLPPFQKVSWVAFVIYRKSFTVKRRRLRVCFLTTQIHDFGAKCAKASHLKLNLFLVSEIHEIHYKHLRNCVFSFRTVYRWYGHGTSIFRKKEKTLGQ